MRSGPTESARAMPMRWRWPPENSCGYFCSAADGSPTEARQLAQPGVGVGLVRVEAVRPHALDQQRLDGLARVEARHRVLEDHLHVLALAAQGLAREAGDVLAVEGHRALGGRLEVEDGAPQGRLAAPGLPHQPVGLATPDLQVDAVDGVHVPHGAVEDHAALDGEVHLETADVDEHVARQRARLGAGPVSHGRPPRPRRGGGSAGPGRRSPTPTAVSAHGSRPGRASSGGRRHRPTSRAGCRRPSR